MNHQSSHCKMVAGLGLEPTFLSSKFHVSLFSFPVLPTRLFFFFFLLTACLVPREMDPRGLGPTAYTNRWPEGDSFFFYSANIIDHCVGRVPRWSPKTPGPWCALTSSSYSMEHSSGYCCEGVLLM